MADISIQVSTLTFTPVADATNYTDNGYVALQGASTTQVNLVKEIHVNGLASTAGTAVNAVFARDVVVGATLTALTTPDSHGGLPVAGAPSLGTAFKASTTKPQRTNVAAQGKINVGLQPFGGISRWQAPPFPGSMFMIVGQAVNAGEASLSSLAGTGPCGVHIIYEPL